MRPYATNERGALAPDMVAKLYVMRPFNDRREGWRLLWARPRAESFCYAEGECSAKIFKTMRAAIKYGQRNYGETATRYVFGEGFV